MGDADGWLALGGGLVGIAVVAWAFGDAHHSNLDLLACAAIAIITAFVLRARDRRRTRRG